MSAHRKLAGSLLGELDEALRERSRLLQALNKLSIKSLAYRFQVSRQSIYNRDAELHPFQGCRESPSVNRVNGAQDESVEGCEKPCS